MNRGGELRNHPTIEFVLRACRALGPRLPPSRVLEKRLECIGAARAASGLAMRMAVSRRGLGGNSGLEKGRSCGGGVWKRKTIPCGRAETLNHGTILVRERIFIYAKLSCHGWNGGEGKGRGRDDLSVRGVMKEPSTLQVTTRKIARATLPPACSKIVVVVVVIM